MDSLQLQYADDLRNDGSKGEPQMIKVNSRVRDANISRIYGPENSNIGIVKRVYLNGMVEVEWPALPIEGSEAGLEDCWIDELTVIA